MVMLLSVLQELNRDKSDGHLSYIHSPGNTNQLDPGCSFQGANRCLGASSWSALPLGLHGCQALHSECKEYCILKLMSQCSRVILNMLIFSVAVDLFCIRNYKHV